MRRPKRWLFFFLSSLASHLRARSLATTTRLPRSSANAGTRSRRNSRRSCARRSVARARRGARPRGDVHHQEEHETRAPKADDDDDGGERGGRVALSHPSSRFASLSSEALLWSSRSLSSFAHATKTDLLGELGEIDGLLPVGHGCLERGFLEGVKKEEEKEEEEKKESEGEKKKTWRADHFPEEKKKKRRNKEVFLPFSKALRTLSRPHSSPQPPPLPYFVSHSEKKHQEKKPSGGNQGGEGIERKTRKKNRRREFFLRHHVCRCQELQAPAVHQLS